MASLVEEADEEKAEASVGETEDATVSKPPPPTRGMSDTIAHYGVETPLRLEGPYFTPANPETYKTVICLVAGTGLSGAIAIAAAFHDQRSRSRSTQKTAAPSARPACTVATESRGNWGRCVVIWTVREKDYVDMPFFKGGHSMHGSQLGKHVLTCHSLGLRRPRVPRQPDGRRPAASGYGKRAHGDLWR